jgi:hypothetical protein
LNSLSATFPNQVRQVFDNLMENTEEVSAAGQDMHGSGGCMEGVGQGAVRLQ